MLKTKVRLVENKCRVGIRIRANPGNPIILKNVALVMVVPPDVMGDKVRMLEEGGIWDSMKRLLSWNLGVLKPGELVELEVQFERLQSSNSTSTPKFPILMRCDGGAIFSGIELSAVNADPGSQLAHMNILESSRILYRKV